ncbi:hypothetical protein BWI93_07810 [Siphonobacter sp. BAB-5385]|nr:hypothetical protein BWI93_07810 [Siphonobacter sp. BAB-5385]
MGVRSVLQQLHWLNLDVAAGAALCAAAASRLPDGKGEINYTAIAVLTLTVWLIYTVDRLLDIRKKPIPATPRHQFHAQHADLFWKVSAGVAVLAGILTLFLPFPLIRFGLILSGVVGLYLFMVNKLAPKSKMYLLKEPITACVYAAGIWGVAFTQQRFIPWQDQALAVMFALIAFQNLILFSWMETQSGKLYASNLASLLRDGIPDLLMYLIIGGIAVLFLSISFTEVLPYQRRFAFTELFMSLVLIEIRRDYPFYLTNERYRWIGDGIFLLPFWLL